MGVVHSQATATILSGQTVGVAFYVGAKAPISLRMPTTAQGFTGTTMTFQGSFDNVLYQAINQGGANGVAFIDDFEGSKTPYDLKSTPTKWKLATTPRRFPESTDSTRAEFGKNRAKLAWYNIDNVFYRAGTDSDTTIRIQRPSKTISSARYILMSFIKIRINNR